MSTEFLVTCRANVLAAFACTLGTLPHMLASITGLAALLHRNAVAFATVKYVDSSYRSAPLGSLATSKRCRHSVGAAASGASS